MKKKTKKLPKFKTEEQESEYWAENDVTEHFDLKSGKKMNFPKLKPHLSIKIRNTSKPKTRR